MPFGRKSPLEALALPGVMLAYKYSQFRQRRREAASRRVTERELSALHHKIDKLLLKLEESEPDPPTSQEDECVICINARATMQTSPCGHRVVCRRCFVKTIQSAVAQRLLPLRCVICRARVNRLTSSSGTWRIQESASSYSMGSKSWASTSMTAGAGGGYGGSGGLAASASSYSMGDATHTSLNHVSFLPLTPKQGMRYPRSPNGRVAPSGSLYSMSSGSSPVSSVTNFSKTSSISSGLYSPSPSSPISPSAISFPSANSPSIQNNFLAPPTGNCIAFHSSFGSLSPGSAGSLSPRDLQRHHRHHHQQALQQHQQHLQQQMQSQQPNQSQHHQIHSHHTGCPSGCSGAIPRKPLQAVSSSQVSSPNGSCRWQDVSDGRDCGVVAGERTKGGGENNVSENGGITLSNRSNIAYFPSTTHTYPGRRHAKGRLMDLQNRLPPIKEFRSPAKVPHPSPVHISNPRFRRYSSYTKSSQNPPYDMLPLLLEPPSPPLRPLNIQMSSSLHTLEPSPLKGNRPFGSSIGGSGGLSAKVSPIMLKNYLPKNAYTMPKDKKGNNNGSNSNNNIKFNDKINTSNLYKNNCKSTSASKNNISNIANNNSNNNNSANGKNNNSKTCGNNKKLLQNFSLNLRLTNGNEAIVSATTATTATTTEIAKTTTTTTNSKIHDHHRHHHNNNSHHYHRISASSRSFPLFLTINGGNKNNNNKEKADNKKNESMERKKKEEKLKIKAEKEARKEEKRLAKEEERLAKLIAKEEKKRSKKEAKELLLANDGNNKK